MVSTVGGEHEVLGWEIIPISLVASLLSYLLAAFMMRRGGRLLLNRGRQAAQAGSI